MTVRAVVLALLLGGLAGCSASTANMPIHWLLLPPLVSMNPPGLSGMLVFERNSPYVLALVDDKRAFTDDEQVTTEVFLPPGVYPLIVRYSQGPLGSKAITLELSIVASKVTYVVACRRQTEVAVSRPVVVPSYADIHALRPGNRGCPGPYFF